MSALRRNLLGVNNFVSTQLQSVWNGFYAMSGESKMAKYIKKIGTHNGTFHCDEALACFMLKTLPEFRDAEIVRTRDESILATCDVVVDVGGRFKPDIHRYDHHQRDFNDTLSSLRPDVAKKKNIKLSSAGLIYAHFGADVIVEILSKRNASPTTECLENLYVHVYETLIEELDAIDNGVPMCPPGVARYQIGTDLSARVNRLNPRWNDVDDPDVDKLFERAMTLVGTELTECVVEAATSWWPARDVVKRAIENRTNYHVSGQIIELDFCPWKNHLYTVENECDIVGLIKFVIFRDKTESWRVQAVPIEAHSFESRVALKKDWQGLRDDKLSDIAEIKDCMFVHATGFIGGNKTKDGAVEMAYASLRAADSIPI